MYTDVILDGNATVWRCAFHSPLLDPANMAHCDIVQLTGQSRPGGTLLNRDNVMVSL